jgi:hypothetical protein
MTDLSRLVLVTEKLFTEMVKQADTQARFRGKALTIQWGEPSTEEVTYYEPVITENDIPVGQVDAQGMTDRTDPA